MKKEVDSLYVCVCIYTKDDVQQLCRKVEHYWECHIH